jgi:hypothetical protein
VYTVTKERYNSWQIANLLRADLNSHAALQNDVHVVSDITLIKYLGSRWSPLELSLLKNQLGLFLRASLEELKAAKHQLHNLDRSLTTLKPLEFIFYKIKLTRIEPLNLIRLNLTANFLLFFLFIKIILQNIENVIGPIIWNLLSKAVS